MGYINELDKCIVFKVFLNFLVFFRVKIFNDFFFSGFVIVIFCYRLIEKFGLIVR